jgi:tetratricopeptide (TPR) repeat protein
MRLPRLDAAGGSAMTRSLRASFVLAGVLLAARVEGQGPPLTLPEPSQAASVTQRIGITDVTVTYHRPAVRKRPVWGELVPYGQVWRAGANENTVLTLSTAASVGGQAVPAGSYGLHMIPGEGDWTVILSKESTAWGSFFYDAAKDAARFTVRPGTGDFHEHLAYTFDEPGADRAMLTLRWETRTVPIPITVDTPRVVTDSLQRELHGLQGFFWQRHAQAANWLASNGGDLDQALTWAERALSMNRNYQTLRAKSVVLEKQGRSAEAAALAKDAMAVATEADINAYGYELLGAGQVDKAIATFRKNVADHPESWNTYDSLGEALAVKGDKTEAIAQYRKALSMAGDDTNKKRISAILAGLEGKPGAGH